MAREPMPDPEKDFTAYCFWCAMYPCQTCGGSGYIDADDFQDETCEDCQGSGVEEVEDYDQMDD